MNRDWLKIFVHIIKVICLSYKQHISLYILDCYNSQQVGKSCIRQLFIDFDTIMRKLVLKKQQHKKINEKTIHNLQDTIGKLLAIDCDSVTNFDSQYKINLFKSCWG